MIRIFRAGVCPLRLFFFKFHLLIVASFVVSITIWFVVWTVRSVIDASLTRTHTRPANLSSLTSWDTLRTTLVSLPHHCQMFQHDVQI